MNKGANTRVIELQQNSAYDHPGLYSKIKRVTLVTNSRDCNKSFSWSDVVEILDQERNKRTKGTIWIDFQGFHSDEMIPVGEYFNIHPLTMEDCMTVDTREKYETFDDYYFIVANEIHYIEYSNVLNNVNIYLIVFPALDIVITIHSEPIQSIQEVVHKLSYEPQGCIPSPDWLVYALFDGVVDIYVKLVDQSVREAESLDGLVLLLSGVEQTELLERIGHANRQSNHLKSGLYSKREILIALRISGRVTSSVSVYMQNVVDHVLRCNQKLKLARETLGSLNSVY
eukprot:TRINITY_DN4071_c0_g1_i4.p1 TRINITY_DN4071_c0_g1~~TRINITY_DN4071_c0_g1_i4.p1  ORF type:complete len:285 (+),score=47.78 TRINITY_DN4071_c0_g1_i4:213-1067(+)